MKKNLLPAALVLIIVFAAGYLILKKDRVGSKETYTWNEITIEAKLPAENQKDLAAIWGPAQLTKEELYIRFPSLKEKPKKETPFEQAAANSEYYYNFLNISQIILVEKLTAYFSQEEKMGSDEWIKKEIGDYKNFDKDFAEWKRSNRIADSSVSKNHENIIKMDLKDKFQNRELRKFFSKKIKDPLQLLTLPPSDNIDLPIAGFAPLGTSKKNVAVLFCDLTSPPCFKAAAIVQDLAKKFDTEVSYRPAIIGDDTYSNLRMKVGFCIAKQDSQKFWSFFESLESRPVRLEELELYEMSGLTTDKVQELKSCMISTEANNEWQAHKKFFLSLPKASIPMLIVNGEPILGPQNMDRASESMARREVN